MSIYVPTDAHIRLKLTGSAEKIAFFHWLVGTMDPDYPQAPPSLRRRSALALCCDKCKGLIYYTPMLTPMQLKSLGKQVNDTVRLPGHLKVKVLMFNLKCGGKPLEGETSQELELYVS